MTMENICHICGIPSDAGFFDESNIFDFRSNGNSDKKLGEGQELVLARYELHRNYCGMLMSFAQFTDKSLGNPPEFRTPGYRWQIRCNGQPRDPYLSFDYILNPWGYGGMPVQLRLEEGCVVELVIRNVGATAGNTLNVVGGRIIGRYWYNNSYGGAPNRL
jgi:hypothetical protein